MVDPTSVYVTMVNTVAQYRQITPAHALNSPFCLKPEEESAVTRIQSVDTAG